MKRLIPLLLLASSCFAAISANTVWEVRTTGSDTNGAGFVAAASGTDMSQFDSKNAAACTSCQSATINISTTDAVTTNTTTVTSATCNCNAALVGNLIYLAGTGTTTGWYQVVSLTFASPPAAVITVDRATGSTGGTGVTMNIGGALATIGQLAINMVTSNHAFIKTGSGYTSTATATFSGDVIPGQYNALFGYTTTRGDGGMVTLTLGTNTGLTGITSTGSGWRVENITVNCSSLGTSTGISLTGSYSALYNVAAKNCVSGGINSPNNNMVVGSEVSGEAGGYAIIAGSAIDNYVHDATAATGGIVAQNAINNVVANLTGASSSGISVPFLGIATRNTLYNIGGSCLAINPSFPIVTYVRGNIMDNCNSWGGGGYGLSSVIAVPAMPILDGNAYLQWFATANRNNVDNTTGINGIGAYANSHDRILTANPFNSIAGSDFSLNNTAGGGHEVRGYGTGVFPGASAFQSFIDMGAVQHWGNPIARTGGAVYSAPFASQAAPTVIWGWVAEGDSVTQGQAATNAVTQGYAGLTRRSLATYIDYANTATPGLTCAQINARYSSTVAPLYSASRAHNIATLMCGLNGNGVAADSYTAIVSWVAAAKATGFTVLVSTITDSQGSDGAYRDTLNASIRSGAVANGYTVVDVGSDPIMGCTGCYSNTTYFVTGLHPTTAGHAIIEASWFLPALNALGLN